MSKTTEMLLDDFHQSLCHVDFESYNPRSAEFETALHIGLMYKLLSEMKVPEVEEADAISEEIEGAQKYWEKYLSTKDTGYRSMADDELRHADMLLSREFDISDKKRAEYKAEIANLSMKVKGAV